MICLCSGTPSVTRAKTIVVSGSINLLEDPPLTTIWIFPGKKVGYSGLLIGGGVPRPRKKGV